MNDDWKIILFGAIGNTDHKRLRAKNTNLGDLLKPCPLLRALSHASGCFTSLFSHCVLYCNQKLRGCNDMTHLGSALLMSVNSYFIQQYAYVPEWAKKILAKSAIERTKNDLSQLHSMLKGLTSYDKFTYRIQLAMCRAMTYNK